MNKYKICANNHKRMQNLTSISVDSVKTYLEKVEKLNLYYKNLTEPLESLCKTKRRKSQETS